jgi:chemotaxis signal transduction protein
MTDALNPAESTEGYLPNPDNPGFPRVVPCRIGELVLGVPVEQAGDMVILTNVTPVALAPPTVRGVLSQQGRMATIVETRLTLGIAPSQPPSLVGLTVEHGGHLYILVVDEVREIVSLDDSQKEIAPMDIGAIVTPH